MAGEYDADIEALNEKDKDLQKQIKDLEELLRKTRLEVTDVKNFLWGMTKNPPMVKKDIC